MQQRASMTSDRVDLRQALDKTLHTLDGIVARADARLDLTEIGKVKTVGQGVARVWGLPNVKSEELVRFENGVLGLAFNLDPDEVGIIILDDDTGIRSNSTVRRTGRVFDVPVGEALLGRVIDAAGRPLDEGGRIRTDQRLPIERDAPPIMDRAPVTQPMQTGIKVIDALLPIGRGQRELIVGDRQTGKTAIALDAIINQQGADVVCVYCSIGQRNSAVARNIDKLREHDALDYCVVVVAAGEDAPGLQWAAPYAATTIGEYFMHQGRDVLIIYDDLTRHARAYRELSLLLRRPPGREAYPGDIFYIHSRMLERSTHLCEGGGSMTALPIVETHAQNISAYIPTNLISITDGQIYLSPQLFQRGVLPAVDVGRSVSRVGGNAQLPAYRKVAGDLRLAYSQFEELETFARFGTRLDEETREKLDRGRRVREIFKQDQYATLPPVDQIVVMLAATHGLLDDVTLGDIAAVEGYLRRTVCAEEPQICAQIEDGEVLDDADVDQLLAVMREILAEYEEDHVPDDGETDV